MRSPRTFGRVASWKATRGVHPTPSPSRRCRCSSWCSLMPDGSRTCRPCSSAGSAATTRSSAAPRVRTAWHGCRSSPPPDVKSALVIAGRRLADAPGAEFLADALTMTPGASRGLLVDWAEAWGGDPEARSDLVRASVLGQFDRLVFAPTADPDEAFFGGISELLDLWARRRHSGFEAVQIVGERWSAETHALRDVLERSSIPAAFHEPGSPEGQRLLHLAGADAGLPVAVFHDGRVLVQPTVTDIAMAVGANAARPTRAATWSSSGQVLPASRRPSMARRRASTCWSSTTTPMAARRARAR